MPLISAYGWACQALRIVHDVLAAAGLDAGDTYLEHAHTQSSNCSGAGSAEIAAAMIRAAASKTGGRCRCQLQPVLMCAGALVAVYEGARP